MLHSLASIIQWLLIDLLSFLTRSIRRSVNIRCREWYPADVIPPVLRGCLRRSNARNPHDDPNPTVHSDTGRSGHGSAIDVVFDSVGYLCADQLCRLCHMGKWYIYKQCSQCTNHNHNNQNICNFHYSPQLSIGVAVLCLPWLRYAQPNLPRPIRVPMVFPIVYLLATVFVTVVPMYASPVETGYGVLMILTAIPVYIIFIAWRSKPKWFNRSMGNSFFWFNERTFSRAFSVQPVHKLTIELAYSIYCFLSLNQLNLF